MKKSEVVKRAADVAASVLKDVMTGNQIPARPPGETMKVLPDGENGKATEVVPPPKPKEVAKPKAKPQRVETILVRHDFTTEEQLQLGQSLADKQRVAESIKAEAKACARQYKDKLASVETEISRVVDEIKDGFKMLSVECIVMAKIDKKAKTVKKCFYRKDTGAFIRDEDALNVELDLFNILPNKDHTKPLDEKLLKSQV